MLDQQCQQALGLRRGQFALPGTERVPTLARIRQGREGPCELQGFGLRFGKAHQQRARAPGDDPGDALGRKHRHTERRQDGPLGSKILKSLDQIGVGVQLPPPSTGEPPSCGTLCCCSRSSSAVF